MASHDQKTRVVGVSFGLFCISLMLTAYSARDPRVAAAGGTVVLEALRPFQSASDWALSGVGGIWGSYVALLDLREENEHLKARLDSLEQHNLHLLELEAENQRLAGLLEIKQRNELGGIVANVIGRSPSSWTSGVTLDRGSLDGVEKGMAVVERNGLVGQVIAVSPNASRVLLVTDPASGVEGVVQETRARGIIEGTGARQLRWNFVAREDEVKVGDRIVTSGSDGLFTKGLLIGVVAEIESRKGGMFQEVEVEPTVDFSKLESVLVIRKPAFIQDFTASSATEPSPGGSAAATPTRAPAATATRASATPTPKASATPKASVTPKAAPTPKGSATPAPKRR